jgi:hypothetical protein
MAVDDQLSDLLVRQAGLYDVLEERQNADIQILGGTIDDPNSFDENGGKTGPLGFYPITNVNGVTRYYPCLARMRAVPLELVDDALTELGEATSQKFADLDDQLVSGIAAIINDQGPEDAVKATFSARKITLLFAAALTTILGGAPGNFDSLSKVSTALGNDPAFAQRVNTATAASVRTDVHQDFAADQAAIARANIAAAKRTTVVVDTALVNTGVDAYAYLQQTLDYAKTLATNGRVAEVVMPDGVFTTSKFLTIPDGVNLRGGANTVIDISGSAMQTGIIALRTTGTVVQKITVRGSGQGSQPANSTNGLVANDVALSGSGIVFAGVKSGFIDQVRVENCGGTTGSGIYNGVAGIWLTFGCQNTTVSDCTASVCRNGINEDNYFGADPAGNKILHNTIKDCRFGIALDSSAIAIDTLVSGNTVTGCKQSGIDLNKAYKARVIGNYVSGCGWESGNSGIWLYGTPSIPSMDCIIAHNTTVGNGKSGTGGSGIKLGPQVYYATATANAISDNFGEGILVTGQCRHWSITSNLIRANRANGIRLFRVDSNNVITTGIISANTILMNYMNGLLLDGGAEVLVTANHVKSNSQGSTGTYDAIRLTNGTVQCLFFGNSVTGGTERYSVAAIDANSTNNVFGSNTFATAAVGRVAFASLVQSWGDNNDPAPTAAGKPTGSQLPYGAKIFNPFDNREYRSAATGWLYHQLLAA